MPATVPAAAAAGVFALLVQPDSPAASDASRTAAVRYREVNRAAIGIPLSCVLLMLLRAAPSGCRSGKISAPSAPLEPRRAHYRRQYIANGITPPHAHDAQAGEIRQQQP